jgi:Fe-S-cluster containining protein
MTTYPTEHVDCNGCRACCRREAVILIPEDTDPVLLAACDVVNAPNPYSGERTTRVLRHRENGDCVFLGEHGCMIYAHRPVMCRTFSCVKFVQKALAGMSKSKLRRRFKAGEFDHDIWTAGTTRLDAITKREAAR